MKIEPNTHVTLAYDLFDEHGELIDRTSEDEPLEYVHGYGMIVPGLERALDGLSAGDQRSVMLSAEVAFGEHNEDEVFVLSRSELPPGIEPAVGEQIEIESPEGTEEVLTVVEVREGDIVVDANHPLAGTNVRYNVRVLAVRPAHEDEIREAGEAFLQAEQSAPGAPDLVQLRNKLN